MGDWVKVGLAVQPSVAVACGMKLATVAEQLALRLTFWLAGQVTEGEVTSTLLTLKLQLAVRPAPSVTVSVTEVLPMPVTVVPAVGDWVTDGADVQLSAALAALV